MHLRSSPIFGCDIIDRSIHAGHSGDLGHLESHDEWRESIDVPCFGPYENQLGLPELDSIDAPNSDLYVDLVAHPGIHDDTSVTENIEESEDFERFCLDFDDQDVEMEETDECIIHDSTDNPFDFDELDYSNYNMLPISVEQADDVASTLDKLVKRGKVKKDGIFYKHLKGVLQVYITPTEYTWDDEVIELFKTLK